jgi:hypothetical protein
MRCYHRGVYLFEKRNENKKFMLFNDLIDRREREREGWGRREAGTKLSHRMPTRNTETRFDKHDTCCHKIKRFFHKRRVNSKITGSVFC